MRIFRIKTIVDLLEVGDDRICRVFDHYVPAARLLEDFSDVAAVGIDETAARGGHNYITLFHDPEPGRLVFACEGAECGHRNESALNNSQPADYAT